MLHLAFEVVTEEEIYFLGYGSRQPQSAIGVLSHTSFTPVIPFYSQDGGYMLL
jgi:hypothetical protein